MWALPKHCQRPLLTGFRCGVFGPQAASVLVRFWLVWGRRAAAFGCFGGSMFGALRFWCVFGSFGAAVPLRFPVLEVLGPSLAV